MKKYLLILYIILFLIMFVSCSSTTTSAQETSQNTMLIFEWVSNNTWVIAGLSLIISVIALMISRKSRKFELTSHHYREILEWYKETIRIIVALKTVKSHKKDRLLSDLSAQIDIGRFFFPNVERGDNYGIHKPEAYRGYRNSINDCLVFIYQLYEKSNYEEYIKHADMLQRLYTSKIFICLNPRKHNKFINKNTYLQTLNIDTIDELLNNNPETLPALFAIDDNEENWLNKPTKRISG